MEPETKKGIIVIMKTTDTKDQKTVQYNKPQSLRRIVKYLLILYLFILPFQTRFIYQQGIFPNSPSFEDACLSRQGVRPACADRGRLSGWEYGTKSLYATEILLLIIILLYIISALPYIIASLKGKTYRGMPPQNFKQNAKQNLLNPFISLPLALLIWSALSILWSYDKTLAWYRWTILLEGVIIYFFILLSSLLEGDQACLRRQGGVKPQINEPTDSIVPVICGTVEPQLLDKNSTNPTINTKQFLYAIPLFAGAVLQSLLAIYQFATQQIIANKWLGIAGHIPETLGVSVVETPLRRWLRAYGSLPHPNILGAYLGIALLFFLLFLLKKSAGKNLEQQLTNVEELKTRGLGIIKVFVIFLLSTAILFTFSRAVWLGLIVAGALLLLQNFLARRSLRKGWSILTLQQPTKTCNPTPKYDRKLPLIPSLGFSVLFICILFISREPIFARLKNENRLEIKSNQERILSYKEGAEIIKTNFLLGTGIGNYTLALYKKNSNLPSYSYQPTHNFFLLLWAELGIIGLITILLFLFFIIKQSIKKLQDKNIMPLILITFLFILMIFDHYFWSLYFGVILLWTSFAFVARHSSVPRYNHIQ